MDPSIFSTEILRTSRSQHTPSLPQEDFLAVEEPLEIRVNGQGLSITMRTPGQDEELATGFLFTEGLIQSRSDIQEIKPCGPITPPSKTQNIIQIQLRPEAPVPFEKLKRNFYTSSSCGVCGKTSIEAVKTVNRYRQSLQEAPPLFWEKEQFLDLPQKLREAQVSFQQTGGIHASALFDSEGNLILLREDVGRHNALDKLIGAALSSLELPLHQSVLLVSGRASFELVQKAAMAGIKTFLAVGAPSSLALQLAQSLGMTLIGFLKEDRYNVYHCPSLQTGKIQ